MQVCLAVLVYRIVPTTEGICLVEYYKKLNTDVRRVFPSSIFEDMADVISADITDVFGIYEQDEQIEELDNNFLAFQQVMVWLNYYDAPSKEEKDAQPPKVTHNPRDFSFNPYKKKSNTSPSPSFSDITPNTHDTTAIDRTSSSSITRKGKTE
jgi:hypothetical protein